MLKITVLGTELFKPDTNEFVTTKSQTLILEHSLISISKWEAKYEKPFLTKDPMNEEELTDYIRFMTINKPSDDLVYLTLSSENYSEIKAYIEAPMTATTFSKTSESTSHRIVTSELIYYWMVASQIPFECEKWHINRLMTLIRVCSAENQAQSKAQSQRTPKGRRSAASSRHAINAARRSHLHSQG